MFKRLAKREASNGSKPSSTGIRIVFNSMLRDQMGISGDTRIEWLSPLGNDGYAEYRDNAFIDRLGIELPKYKLSDLWPRGGPQWDGLGKIGGDTILLVEAKAHIPEVISHLAAKSPASEQKIKASLQQTKEYLHVRSQSDWSSPFYQYANRIAHLYLLRVLNGIRTYLVFVNFLNDGAMGGPETEEEWKGAIRLIHAYLGIGRNKLGRFIINVFPDVRDLTGVPGHA